MGSVVSLSDSPCKTLALFGKTVEPKHEPKARRRIDEQEEASYCRKMTNTDRKLQQRSGTKSDDLVEEENATLATFSVTQQRHLTV